MLRFLRNIRFRAGSETDGLPGSSSEPATLPISPPVFDLVSARRGLGLLGKERRALPLGGEVVDDCEDGDDGQSQSAKLVRTDGNEGVDPCFRIPLTPLGLLLLMLLGRGGAPHLAVGGVPGLFTEPNKLAQKPA